MRRLFLDTSAYSAFKRGVPQVLEEIRSADRLVLNAVVIGELLSGFDRGKFTAANRKELRAFLGHSSVEVWPMTEETSERYSFIHVLLKRQGTPIPTNDLWIAAGAMESGSILLTGDKHFLKVKQVPSIFIDTL